MPNDKELPWAEGIRRSESPRAWVASAYYGDEPGSALDAAGGCHG